jgi:hypothetical protein
VMVSNPKLSFFSSDKTDNSLSLFIVLAKTLFSSVIYHCCHHHHPKTTPVIDATSDNDIFWVRIHRSVDCGDTIHISFSTSVSLFSHLDVG